MLILPMLYHGSRFYRYSIARDRGAKGDLDETEVVDLLNLPTTNPIQQPPGCGVGKVSCEYSMNYPLMRSPTRCSRTAKYHKSRWL